MHTHSPRSSYAIRQVCSLVSQSSALGCLQNISRVTRLQLSDGNLGSLVHWLDPFTARIRVLLASSNWQHANSLASLSWHFWARFYHGTTSLIVSLALSILALTTICLAPGNVVSTALHLRSCSFRPVPSCWHT
jgi:hypothetical protein